MTHERSSIEQAVTEFLQTTLRGKQPEPHDDLFALGYVSSLSALELVTFLEGRFEIAVEVEDLRLDNFRSLSRIVAFVQHKLSAGAGAGESP